MIIAIERNGETIKWYNFDIINNETINNTWQSMEVIKKITSDIVPSDKFVIYYMNNNEEDVFIDDFKIEFLK